MLLRSPTLALAAGLLTVLAALLSPALLPAGATSPAVAASPNHAGVVIDTGSGSRSYCVSFTQDSIDGIQLLRLADEQAGGVDPVFSQTSIGTAVCALRGTGCPADDCFCDPNRYWNYATGSSGGGWSRAQRGAEQRTVADGDVDGWAWGGEGATPPATGFDRICADAAADRPTPTTSPTTPPSPAGEPSTPTPPPASARPSPRPSPNGAPPATSGSPTTNTPTPTEPTATATAVPSATPTAAPSATATAAPSSATPPPAAAAPSPSPDAGAGATPQAAATPAGEQRAPGSPWQLLVFAAIFGGIAAATVVARRRRP